MITDDKIRANSFVSAGWRNEADVIGLNRNLLGVGQSGRDSKLEYSNIIAGEVLDGTDGDDHLTGGRGDDLINGGAGNDTLIGNGGRDIINGGDGDDYIADGWGTGTMDGGDGVDTLDVSHTKTGNVIDLVAGTIDWDGHSPTETAINFENVIGSNGDNIIIGTNDANILEGRAGNDTFIGGGGDDTLYGGLGGSTYVYNLGDGSDVIYNGVDKNGDNSGSEELDVSGVSDDNTHHSDDQPNIVNDSHSFANNSSQDKIVFGDGITQSDIEITLSGPDLILSLPDNETMTLKDFEHYPVETIEFADGSTMDISGYQSQDWVGRNKFLFWGGNDTHFGGEADDTLNGRSGNDKLFGAGGDDTILGGKGNDKLFGGAGDDTINGGSGKDTIFGDEGDDTISGGYGVDHLDGGAGNDTVDYAYSTENVDIDLAAGQSIFGSGKAEITANFENVIGSQGDNVITGTSGANTIDGGAGDDVINAGAGDDRLKGGSGADTFAFSKGDGIDIIDDFDPDTDTLQISGAGNDSIIIQYMNIGTLITYGRDENGNPTDQVFLVGVGSGLVTRDDIVQPDVEYIGSNDADIFEGTDADEEIYTHDGDDEINANGGNDYIEAGDGADVIHAGNGNDTVDAGLGADQVWLDAGNDVFVDDAETGPLGNDVVYGGDGDDLFLGAGGDDTFYGEAGSDTLNGGAGNDTLVGDAGTADGKLFASYYRLTKSVNSVNDIPKGAVPDGTALVGDLDVGALALSKGGNDSYYGVHYTGVIEITAAGTYTFQTGSDDGSELWIGGIKVVSNDGLHPMAYQNGSIDLEPGIYQFELNFFEKTGENLLEVTVQGPDTGDVALDIFASNMLGDAALSDDALTGFGLDDVLNGGVGDDLLIGGSGSDIIELDFGDGIDVMTDFEDGLDIIDLTAMSGLTFADLEINTTATGVEIIYEVDGGNNPIGVLNLDGITKDDISQADFLFG